MYFKHFTWKLYSWTKALKFSRTRWRWLIVLTLWVMQFWDFPTAAAYTHQAALWNSRMLLTLPYSDRHRNLPHSDMKNCSWDLHETSLQPPGNSSCSHSWGQDRRGVSRRIKAPASTCNKTSQSNEPKKTGGCMMEGVREAKSSELNCAQRGREMVPGVQRLAWQERLCRLGVGENRGKDPTNISSKKLGINWGRWLG